MCQKRHRTSHQSQTAESEESVKHQSECVCEVVQQLTSEVLETKIFFVQTLFGHSYDYYCYYDDY